MMAHSNHLGKEFPSVKPCQVATLGERKQLLKTSPLKSGLGFWTFLGTCGGGIFSHNFHPAAMALVESQAAFKRCDKLSSDGTLHTAMGREGIVTLSGSAFVLGTPQVAPTEAQFDGFANRLFPLGPTTR